MRRPTWTVLTSVLMLAALVPAARGAVRIKDITEVEGARNNQLVGFGLVVGLENTGGRSVFTQQVAADMMQRFNVASKTFALQQGENVFRTGNISAVMVTTEIGPYMRRGSRADIIVSVLDDASSLQGGTLILTPLKGADGIVYAVAQGPLSIGGFLFTAPTGTAQPLATVQKNHPTVGRIPGGAIIEREVRGEVLCNGQMRLLLRDADHDTAQAIADVINEKYPRSSYTLDPGTVHIVVPPEWCPKLVGFIGEIGKLEVSPDVPARVVINERTGTIVAGERVKVATVAVAHANLSIVSDLLFAGQGGAGRGLGGGAGVGGVEESLKVNEGAGSLRIVPRTVTVADLARALNLLGVTPRDLISIFQALKQAGALHAELIIM